MSDTVATAGDPPAASAARQLADEVYAYRRATEQELALWNNQLEHLEHWDDLSPAGEAARLATLASFGERARALLADRSLSDADSVLLEMTEFLLDAERVLSRWRAELYWVNPAVGLVSTLEAMLPRYVLLTEADGAAYLTKIERFSAFTDQWIARIRRSVAEGRMPIAHLVRSAVANLDALLAQPLSQGGFAGQAPPQSLDDEAAARWRGALHAVLDAEMAPALDRLRACLRDDVLPQALPEERPGLCHLAGGDEHYAAMVRAVTSTALTPRQIHDLGLRQIERLEDEYRSVAGPAFGTGDIDEIYRRMRDDPAMHYADATELVANATDALERAWAAAPAWFGRLPVAPCEALAIDTGAMAYYSAPARDGSKPGAFFFNTSDPAAWGRFELQATTFHEGIPGHHLQLALVQELPGLHPLQADFFVGAYCEGWALYTERLADEMGLYSTPIDRLGMLANDSLRACRLVVDTGLHALGWTRQQAITYMVEHSPMTQAQIAGEIDRYIGDPAQALGYMVGRLEIDRLRADAEKRLGERFDIRAFHDVVLGSGSVPLGTLARVVDEWIAGEAIDGQAAPAGAS